MSVNVNYVQRLLFAIFCEKNMKNRIRKKNLCSHCKLPRQFVKDTLRALAEAKAGKLSPYNFSKRSKRRLGALKGKIKIADDFDAYITLDDLADAAKAAADRASTTIDETLEVVEDSNKRMRAKELRGSVLRYDNPTDPIGLDDWEANE